MHVTRACSSSVEDARATLLLYKLAATPWEKEIASIAATLEGRRDKRAKSVLLYQGESFATQDLNILY